MKSITVIMPIMSGYGTKGWNEMKIVPVSEMLQEARQHGYGVGSFSPRNTYLIEAVLKAAQAKNSPVIVQISANEFNWFQVSSKEFAKRFYELADQFTVKAALHLDHTKDIAIIKEAIDAGFNSVMIDASAQILEDNIRITKEVVEYAHTKNVEVEAELGKIGATDKIETDNDQMLYTDPAEAEEFVARTGVDTLAVSIGTAHGVYPVKNPKIDLERLSEIRNRVSIPLVLHGGSGLPAETVLEAIRIPNGGVSKINIATDLEQAFLRSLGCERMLNQEILNYDVKALKKAALEVQKVVEEKIEHFVCSAGKLV